MFNLLFVSDFNVDNLCNYLSNGEDAPAVRAVSAPYDQVARVLSDAGMECWKPAPQAVVVWTQPEKMIPAFNKILNAEPVTEEEILSEVDAYAALLENTAKRTSALFIPTWVYPKAYRSARILDMRSGAGIAGTLMRMNLRLADRLAGSANCYLLDTQSWIEKAGYPSFQPKLWYMAKIAFSNEVLKIAERDLRSHLRALSGDVKKIILVDLDNTLWGGIVGDIGKEQLQLGGHDAAGEAYADFQNLLKSFTRRGILLGIVSKNEEATALDAIDTHPEMILKRGDFAGWRINWKDKAENIRDLIASLNIGLDSAVFIDDNPVERDRVKTVLPQVLVPDWPQDPALYRKALLELDCFNAVSVSREDAARTRMYRDEEARSQMKSAAGSFSDWLATLGMKLKVEELNAANLPRTAQLMNKTNQMNLSTRRMTETELMNWTREGKRKLWTVRVSDKFGDMGLTGIVSLDMQKDSGRIADFILSCRVMGRKVEEAMLAVAIHHARGEGLSVVRADYIKTPKNNPCLEFFLNSGFIHENGTFTHRCTSDYPFPAGIELTVS